MNFVSVRWGGFIFLDTMNFFKGKLEELWHVVANHEEKKDSKGHSYWDETNENLDVFETTNEIIPLLYPNVDPKKAMKGKGRIPYAWLTKERMKHKCFPTDLDSWFDDLYGEETKREDVDRYIADFDAFQCQSVEEGRDIYLTKYNCILMDIVSHFNKFTMKQFHIDIGKFVSLPNLSWLAWLLSLDPSKEIGTVTTIDQYNICEYAERGGLSQCRMPWVRANIAGRAGYRVGLPNSRIYYTDINSLYASAMRYFMPIGNFILNNLLHDKPIEEATQFVSYYEKELNNNLSIYAKYDMKFNNAPSWKQSSRGFIVLIAGHYPKETHHKNNDLPTLFLNRKITKTDKINKKGYGNEPITNRLIASLLPVGEHDGKKLEALYYMELKIAL